MSFRKNFFFHPRYILFFLLLNTCSWSQAQPVRRENFFTGGVNAGMIGFSPSHRQQISGGDYFARTGNYGFGNLQNVDGEKRLALIANTSIGVNGGFTWSNKERTNYMTVFGEFQNNKACYSFNPPFLFSVDGDTFGKWVMADKYLKYSGGIQFSWYRGDYSWLGGQEFYYVRASYGQTFNHRNFEGPLEQGRFEDWSEGGTGMTATTVKANRSGPMLSSEIGIRSFSDDHKQTLDIGIVYHQPFSTSYTDRYKFTQGGISTGVSHVTFTGATVTMNLRLNWNWKLPERPIDTTKTIKEKPKPDIVLTDTADKRDIDVQSRMSAGSDMITIWVWDKDKVDGDIITLFLNDEPILTNLELTRNKEKVKVRLKPGYNYLVMRAENLGEIPPNTAAMEISDGKGKRNFTVNSDTGKSGAIEIVYGK
ncbi:MAG: hypothetical protein FD123_1657 [Bacteroidetes bacterium]|nr:MAG: hypothetical protein FD123_1657 [Bacteroidota bacterium]